MFSVEGAIKIIRSNGLGQDDCYAQNCDARRSSSKFETSQSGALWGRAAQFTKVVTGRTAVHVEAIKLISRELLREILK